MSRWVPNAATRRWILGRAGRIPLGGTVARKLSQVLFWGILGSLCAQPISTLPIYSLAISSQAPNVVYAGSDGEVLRIVDGEYTRSVLPEPARSVKHLAADQTDAKRVIAVARVSDTASLVCLTTDGGGSWCEVLLPKALKYSWLNHWIGNFGAVTFDPENPRIITLAAEARASMHGSGPYDLGCVLSSTDLGNKWAIATVPRLGFKHPRPVHSVLSTSRCLFFSTPKGVFRFRNDAKKYDGLLKNSPENVTILAGDPSNRERFIAATGAGAVYETTNSGDSFFLLGHALSKTRCLFVDPATPMTLWIGTPAGIKRSNDKGATWTAVPGPNAVNAFAMASGSSSVMYCGSDSGLFVSTNKGESWGPFMSKSERRAAQLLIEIDSLTASGQMTAAMQLCMVVRDSFPALPAAQKAEASRLLALANARARLARVSVNKVQRAIDRLRLNEQESNALAVAVYHVSADAIVRIVQKGLGMPLDREECVEEYGGLNLHQRFYVMMCYKDFAGDGAAEVLANLLNVSWTTAEKMVGIKPASLLQ